ncbi:MAG: acyl-CoA dehydrogenase family protein [Candidatus Aminicenantes bacterium]|nr:acyl-CoA dehydrogenase family protein [Candidatus Aminicenantes bacterium]MDH5384105.1 acyl-CoA dehydrogenase family protein [Candidatus Aminicenantes bacterium]
MNFELSEDQILIREMVRDFAQNEIVPHQKALENKHEFPNELLEKLAKLGVLGMSIPSEYEGNKTDTLSLMLTIEQISKAFPSLAVIISVHCSLFCQALLKFGTETLKKKYLPKAAKGEVLGAFALTEPGAGSDVHGLKSKAVKKGGTYILNGTKSWVTTGSNADAYILFALTETEPSVQRLSAFIVENSFPGFRVSKVEEKMGLHASITSEVVLEDCRVPAENLLGEEGRGASIALHCLDGSRIGIAAQSVGLSQRALEEAVKYAKQREAFGKPIAEFQAIQFMIADMSTLIESARLLTYKAAILLDKGLPISKEASMAKLFASEAANKIAYMALQVHGGYGYSQEFFVEQLYRDARVLTIYEGTSEIQRLVISRHLLRE